MVLSLAFWFLVAVCTYIIWARFGYVTGAHVVLGWVSWAARAAFAWVWYPIGGILHYAGLLHASNTGEEGLAPQILEAAATGPRASSAWPEHLARDADGFNGVAREGSTESTWEVSAQGIMRPIVASDGLAAEWSEHDGRQMEFSDGAVDGGMDDRAMDGGMDDRAMDGGMDDRAMDEGMDDRAMDGGMDDRAMDGGMDDRAMDGGMDDRAMDGGMDDRAMDGGMDDRAMDGGMDDRAMDGGMDDRAMDGGMDDRAMDGGMDDRAMDGDVSDQAVDGGESAG